MAWKSAGMRAISSNLLVPSECTIGTGTSGCDTGFGPENTMDYLLAPPTRFSGTGAATKTIVYDFSPSIRTIDAFAVIEAHSGAAGMVGDESYEIELRFQLRYKKADDTIATAQSYVYVPGTNQDSWGSSFFCELSSSVSAKALYLDVQRADGNSVGAATLGAVLAGRIYQFPTNPLLPHARADRSSSVVLVGAGAPIITARNAPRREIGVRFRFANEDTRGEFARMLVGRGRKRSAVLSDLARRRLDLPTALIMPEMWVGATNYGGCIYGMFTGGVASQFAVGASAYVDATFEEIV